MGCVKVRREVHTGVRPIVSICHRQHVPGAPAGYGRDELRVVSGMLAECLNDVGGLKELTHRGAKVAIRVNAGFAGPPAVHTTDPRVLEALILLLQDELQPSLIVVVESAADHHMLREINEGRTSRECFELCGIADVARRTGVDLQPVEEDEHAAVSCPGARIYKSQVLPRSLIESEFVIYVPHMKTHMACGVTLGIKLGQGSIPHFEQKKLHRADLPQKLVDILHVVRPHLTIIDGLWAQQGQGPTSPYPEDIITDMNVLVASRDIVAADAVGSAIMGFNPFEVSTTWLAHSQQLGIGALEGIERRGKPIDEVRRLFRRPDMRLDGMYPNVRFFVGGACIGCLSHLRIYLDQLSQTGVLADLKKPINIIVGFRTELPGELDGTTLVIGDCSSDHRDKGIYVPGCCPLARILEGLIRALAEST